MKKRFLKWVGIATIFFLTVGAVKAQNESDEKPLINVNSGISIKRDSLFLLNLRFRMQNRTAFNTIAGDDLSLSTVEARIRRLRLRLDGYLLSPKLSYYIQLSFSKADQDLEDQEIPQVIRDGIVYYTVNKRFYFGFGQTKLPGNNERVVSSGNLQFADRSLANAIFNVDRDFGLFGYYTTPLGSKSLLKLKAAATSGEGRNASTLDAKLAYTGRIELLPFGSFANNGDYSMGDLEREANPKLSLAVSYHRNNGAVREFGTRGDFISEARELTSLFADLVFKYRGFAFHTAFMNRSTDDPIIENAIQNPVYFLVGSGSNTQASYIFDNNWEIAARYSRVSPDNTISEFETATEIIDFGGTKYLNAHRVKVQSNIQYRYKNNNMSLAHSGNRWGLILQVEVGI